MALTLEQKKTIVAELGEVAGTALSAVVAEYRGLSGVDMAKLRVEARRNGVFVRVAKNSLVKRAVRGTDFACLDEVLAGPLVFAFSREDPGAAARVVKDFTKNYQQLVAKAAAIDGQLLPASEIDRLAKLPTRDQAISMLMAVIKAPLDKFARTLAEPHAKLARTLAAVRDQKEQEQEQAA